MADLEGKDARKRHLAAGALAGAAIGLVAQVAILGGMMGPIEGILLGSSVGMTGAVLLWKTSEEPR